MDSDSINDSESIISQTTFTQPLSQAESSNPSNKNPFLYANSKYNKDDYKFDKSDIYVFNQGLFTRSLLPIDYSIDRKMFIKYII